MKSILAAALLAVLSSAVATADPLSAPTGEVILTVTGDIDNPNASGAAVFDLAMLTALAGRQAIMETPWADVPTQFEGPFLKAVLEAAGAHGSTLRVKALNDYMAEVPVEDATSFETILAVAMNGQAMSVRDKGPVFLVYPFDTHPELYNEKYFSRSVWQIKEIEVVP
jgi:hypothetical protein